MADQRSKLTNTSVERGLQKLEPQASKVDRDQLMYLAGQQSMVVVDQKVGAWVWKCATIVSTSAAVLLAVVFADTYQQLRIVRDNDRQVNESVAQHLQESEETLLPDVKEVDDENFSVLALRDAMIREGVDSLPARPPVRSMGSSGSYWDHVRAIDEVDKFARPALDGPEESKGLWGQVLGWGANL